MGDVSTEPTMEEILSSIKRVIEESETAPPAPRPRRSIPRAFAADSAANDTVLELSERVPFPAAPGQPESPVRTPGLAPTSSRAESLLSPRTAEATRGPLEALSRMVVKPETPGSDTLEGMVRDMLRPMLREWLDASLPAMVEAMVASEIARISGREL